MNDTHLTQHIELAQTGNRESQKWIYESYVGFVYNLIRKYISDEDTAADAAQETMITVMDKLKNFDSEKGAFKSWVAKIAIHKALRWIKVFERNQRLEGVIELAQNLTHYEGIRDEVDQLVKGLAPKQREIYKLYFDLDLDHAEIAELLQISQENSRVRVYRLISEIRGKLKL